MPKDSTTGLTRVELRILLTLLDGPLHGHAIKAEVRRRSDGEVELGPGTLYGAIDRLERRGFLKPSEPPRAPETAREARRRYVAVTPTGVEAALVEVESVDRLLAFARSKIRAADLKGTP